MENKQTAVEWLELKLEKQNMFDGFAWEDKAYFMKLLQRAKAMEKEQIKDAYEYGYWRGNNDDDFEPEEYYKNPYYNPKHYYENNYGASMDKKG